MGQHHVLTLGLGPEPWLQVRRLLGQHQGLWACPGTARSLEHRWARPMASASGKEII